MKTLNVESVFVLGGMVSYIVIMVVVCMVAVQCFIHLGSTHEVVSLGWLLIYDIWEQVAVCLVAAWEFHFG